MRLGVTDYIDCAHTLSGHPKCGQLHGHTYRIELVVEGDAAGGMLLDFADLKGRLRGVLAHYDHKHWNDFMDYPTVENICERLAGEVGSVLSLDFTLRVYEGHAKWAETGRGKRL
jgi:6-pyruvoyltetrahydropterin/6-carboxytetrahydropterin synthase